MDRAEIDSFVNKFKALCDAGYNASLNLESKLGEVFVNLSCKVGRTTPPPFTPPAPTPVDAVSKYRSPSYYRRQARHKATRDTDVMKVKECKNLVAEEVSVTLSQEEYDITNNETVVKDNADASISLDENGSNNDDYTNNNDSTTASDEVTAADKVEDEHPNEVSEKDEDTVRSKNDAKTNPRMVYYAFVPPPMR